MGAFTLISCACVFLSTCAFIVYLIREDENDHNSSQDEAKRILREW